MSSTMDGLAELWTRILSAQPSPRPEVLFGTAVAAAIAVLYRPVWRVLRTVITIVHEAGHALVAVCVGRRLSRIELHSDTSGLTISRGRARGPGMVATLVAGYLAPPLAGLAAAVLLARGYVTGMLALTVLILLVLLTRVRGGYGMLAVLVTAAVVAAVAGWASVQAQAVFAYAFTWFLLAGGFRPVVELWSTRGRRGGLQSDADQLGRLTGVAGGVWVVAFALVNAAVLVAGVGVLVPRFINSVLEFFG